MMPNDRNDYFGQKIFSFPDFEFASNFECGNLSGVKEDQQTNQYQLEIATDACPNQPSIPWTCWFFFKITAKEPGKTLNAVIKNMTNQV